MLKRYMLAVVAVLAVGGVPAASAESPFLLNRAPMKQTMNALLADTFYVEMRCAEDCNARARLVMAPHDAKAAGFKGVKPGQWFEIGRVSSLELTAGTWTKVRIPLTPVAKRVLRKAKDGVKFAGQALAESTVSSRYGSADWVRTCKWPRK